MSEKKCFFKNRDGSCSVIMGYCNNNYEKCKFYKTERQYVMARNMAIIKNRKKGNCKNCKYVYVPCDFLPLKFTNDD